MKNEYPQDEKNGSANAEAEHMEARESAKSRRFTVCVYCFGVIMFTALCLLVVMNLDSIFSAVGKVTEILKPLLYGFFIAFTLNPLQMWLYERFIPFVEKTWSSFAAFVGNKTPLKRIAVKKRPGKVRTERKAAKRENAFVSGVLSRLKKPDKEERKKPDGRRTASIILTYAAVIILLALLFVAVIPQVGQSYNDLSGSLSDYVKTAQSFVDNMTDSIPVLDFGFLKPVSSEEDDRTVDTLFDLSDTINNALTEFYGLLSDITPSVISAAKTIVTEAKNILLGLIISIYFIMSKEKLKHGIMRVVNAIISEKTSASLYSYASLLYGIFVRFISNRFIDAIILTAAYALMLLVFSIRYAPLVAVIIGVLNLIPYLGPMIGILICSFIVFVSNPPSLVLFLIIVVTVQTLDYYLIEKKLLHAGAGLPPVWIMVSVVIAGGIAGVAGMFLAVPIFAVIYAIIRKAVEKAETRDRENSETGKIS